MLCGSGVWTMPRVWWGGGLPSTNLVWTEPRCDAVASLRPWSAWLVGGGTWGDALRQSRFFRVTLGTLRQSKWYLKIINGNPMGKIIYKWCIFFCHVWWQDHELDGTLAETMMRRAQLPKTMQQKVLKARCPFPVISLLICPCPKIGDHSCQSWKLW